MQKCRGLTKQQNFSVHQSILYCTTISYEVFILHIDLENLITNHGTRKKNIYLPSLI